MAIYVIIPQLHTNQDKLPGAISSIFPNDHLKVSDKDYLVATKDSIQDVSRKLGIADGSNGSGIIIQVGAYFGRADPNIWNWIKAKWEATSNG